MQYLYKELNNYKSYLEERTVIEHAKSILVSRKNIPEDEAYTYLTKLAVSQKKEFFYF